MADIKLLLQLYKIDNKGDAFGFTLVGILMFFRRDYAHFSSESTSPVIEGIITRYAVFPSLCVTGKGEIL